MYAKHSVDLKNICTPSKLIKISEQVFQFYDFTHFA